MSAAITARGNSLYTKYEKSYPKQENGNKQNIMEQAAAQSEVSNIKQIVAVGQNQSLSDPDALFSFVSAKTGETVKIYRNEDYYSDLHPTYTVKGTYSNGQSYEKQVDVSLIDPYNCTFLGFLALSVHTMEHPNQAFAQISFVADRVGTENFFQKENYMGAAADLMNEQKKTGNWSGYLDYSSWIHGMASYAGCAEPEGRLSAADRKVDGKTAPYSSLADENGDIEYNGVIMHCDLKNNALCIGNMSNEKNVLTIPLSKGGSLKINRDNFGCLSSIISMFSPEDRFLIIRAITLDNQIQKIKNDIDNEDFSETETENYSITKDEESGEVTIYDKQSDSKFVLHAGESLNIQKNAVSSLKMLVQYQADGSCQRMELTQELENALKTAFHSDTLNENDLTGYSVYTDERSGIRYLAKEGEANRGIPLLDEEMRVKLLLFAERTEEEDSIAETEKTETGEENSGEGEETSKQEIIIQPDGTRVLMLTTNIGGMQTVMTLKLSENEISSNSSADAEAEDAVRGLTESF